MRGISNEDGDTARADADSAKWQCPALDAAGTAAARVKLTSGLEADTPVVDLRLSPEHKTMWYLVTRP